MSERFNVIFICDFFVCDLNLCKNLQAAVEFCKLFLYNSFSPDPTRGSFRIKNGHLREILLFINRY